MKFSKLLVLGALLATVSSAKAEVPEGVWDVPEPQGLVFTDFTADDYVYYHLYNPASKMFFASGNDWNTRASLAAFGYKVWFVTTTEPDVPEGLYELWDDCQHPNRVLGEKNCFTDDGGGTWVDHGDQGNYSWSVTKVGDCYRIQNAALIADKPEFDGKYLGWNGTGDTRLYMLDPAQAGVTVDWKFVTDDSYEAFIASEGYAAYVAATEMFFVAMDVKAALVEAESLGANIAAWLTVYTNKESTKDELNAAKEAAQKIVTARKELKQALADAAKEGVDASAWQAVYDNGDATVEELEAATAAVKKAINEKLAGDVSVDKPADMTASIQNPNFDNASYDGWKGSAPNMKGDGNHEPANVPEFWNASFDTYQDLPGMPQGVYKLSASAFFRGDWNDHVKHENYIAYLYGRVDGDTLKTEIVNPWDALNTEPMAGATEFGTNAAEAAEEHDGTTYYIPADPSAARLYFEKGLYQNEVFFALEGTDPMRIGVSKASVIRSQFDWVVFDNFKLTYYGNAAEAYQYWVDQKKATKIDYSESEAKISPMYVKAYNDAFDVTASNKAEAVAAMKGIQSATDSINTNINLWKDLAVAFEKGQQHTVGKYAKYDAAQELAEYMTIELELEDQLNDPDADFSNQEIKDIIETINIYVEQIQNAEKNALKPDTEVTEYMTNPDFEDNGGSNTGWTIVSKGGGNVQLGGNADNHCYEAWHSTNFDIYQEVSGLPAGVYEISVQGYVRFKDGQDAINAKDESMTVFENGVPIYVYLNDSKTNLMNWFSCPNPTSFYDEVSGATYLTEDDDHAYPDNMTAASAAFKKGDYTQSAMGLIAHQGDVMRIGVKGTPAATFWPIFDNFRLIYRGYAADVVKPVLETTLAKALAFQGLTFKEAKDALNAAITESNTALGLTGEDAGETMFTALVKLESALNAAEAGKTACEDLYAALNELMTEAQTSQAAIAAEAQQEGGKMLSQLESSEMTEIEVESAMGAVRKYMLLLRLPDNYTVASEAEPKDLTAFIQCPSFSKMGADGVEVNALDGWQNTTGSKIGDNAEQQSALAVEFWQTNFDMYQDVEGVGDIVLPNGYYKLNVNAYAQNAPTAVIYAVGEETYETPFVDIDAGLLVPGFEGVAKPNSLRTAGDAFEAGCYLNELIVKVSANKLRIGVKYADNKNGGDWIAMDNFKLTYFGTEPLAIQDINADSKAPVMKVEFYTLDGRKASFANKGIMIQKLTLGDGTIVVKKIRK